jgi:hypothetical protein
LRVIDALETPQQGRADMASSGKRKTTMAKLTRESKLRERRLDKQARKEARKQAQALGLDPNEPSQTLTDDDGPSDSPDAEQPALEPVPQAPADA